MSTQKRRGRFSVLTEESEDECLIERGREFQITSVFAIETCTMTGEFAVVTFVCIGQAEDRRPADERRTPGAGLPRVHTSDRGGERGVGNK